MVKRMPGLPVIVMALRQRLLRWTGRDSDPHRGRIDTDLSPSARHFADYHAAPLALSYAVCSPADAGEWQVRARTKFAELAGYERGSGIPEIVQEDMFPLGVGMTRRRIYLKARSGVVIPIHLIGQLKPKDPRPVMICLQGTNTGAHLSWGERRFPADADKSMQGYDIALQAARRGYLAIAIEQSCFGERSERQISPRSPAPCVDAAMHALLLGRSLPGERCSDVSAVIDWLYANADGLSIDPRRIHIMGHSSGGSVGLFAAALDPRIGAVLACGCVGFIRDTIGRRRDDQGQNVVPGILKWMELADIVGLIAPRPFATVAGDCDHIWPSTGAAAVIEQAKSIYAALGATDRIRHVGEPGGHRFRPEASWAALSAIADIPATNK